MKRSSIFGITLAVGAVAITTAGAVQFYPFNSAPATAAVVKQSVLSVQLSKPQKLMWPQVLYANGAIAPWHEAVIGAEVSGVQVKELLVDVGDKVTKGQVIARLAQDAALATVHQNEAAVSKAKSSLAEAQANANRARQVKGSGALSEQQIKSYLIAEETAQADLESAQAALEAAQVTYDHTTITAPDDGVITSRSATLGAVVSTGTEMFRLLRQNKVEWQAELDAVQIANVKEGQKAVVSLPSGQSVTGYVRMAAPSLNTSTSRGIVYVTLPSDSGAKAGTYGSGTVELDDKEALTVPLSALVLRDGHSYVFVVSDDSRAVRNAVETGRRRNDRVEILSGIDAGSKVVESGGAFLSDGSPVTVLSGEK